MAPTKQNAIFITEIGPTFGRKDVPKPGPGQILVKVVAAAQNPTDWKSIGRALKASTYGAIVGNDFAGTVEELGPDVPAGVRTVGERVGGFVAGTRSANGTFAEYVVAEAEHGIVPIPESWSFEEAAQLGVAPFTAMQCLHQTLELSSPFEARSGPQRPILIWGGASSVGQYVIQFAKLGGLRVITTASPKNFDLVKGLGADEVFDYRDESVVENIRATTGNALDIAVDTISDGKTPEQVTSAIGDKGGKVAIILPYESPRSDVKVKFSMAPDLLDRVRPSFKKFFTDVSNGKWYVDLLTKMLATGKIKPNPVDIQLSGLVSVKGGLQYMQEGKVSAQKITYRIADTPDIPEF
ncbi:dehydrogenase [Lactarius psammicola]|nr:dehydrogenase [Lactarius psammicola]